ncbi:MAG TPA: hypothetical protein PLL10_08390, partial [Elusimicrobiales bacterium]|nr:hypothetical protein [Elusimicrobiales bacterium]
HFAGYDVMVPAANRAVVGSLNRDSSAAKAPDLKTLGLLRRWGVRWYVLPAPLPRHFEKFILQARLAPLNEDEGRTVYEDKAALPLAWRLENGHLRPLENHVRGNSWLIATADQGSGCLVVNTLYNEGFSAWPQGAQASRSNDGQTVLCYPAATALVKLEYSDKWLKFGSAVAGVLLALAATGLLCFGPVIRRLHGTR